jgi:predicted membrane-bound dolichyl-phosphate-mannose-protein mannosyltransferase
MGILLILAQIALVILDLLAHVVTLNMWIVFLPAILFAVVWLLACAYGGTFYIDRLNPIGPRRR